MQRGPGGHRLPAGQRGRGRALLFTNATRTSIGGLRIRIPCSRVAAPSSRLMIALLAPMIGRRRRDRSPVFVVAPRRCLPAVECCRGARLCQAAKSRSLRNVVGGGARAAMAVAIGGPMPGTGISRRAISLSLARRAIPASSLPVSVSRWASAAINTFGVEMSSEGKPPSGALIKVMDAPRWPRPAARSVRIRSGGHTGR